MSGLNKNGKILNIAIAIVIILIGASLRLVPHPPNFAPIAAIALFGGVYLSKKTAMALPLTAMLLSDIFLGFYEVKLMAFVYGSFLLCVVSGFWIKSHKKWQTILGGAFFCSLIFFVLTNFAVWVFTPWYAKTFDGLVQCYLMALPFFKNTLSGDLFYAFVFFGSYELITLWVKKRFTIKEAVHI
jgi:hypothetical protein